MSTKTTFKRIALVLTAAIGLSLLSTVPSKATVNDLTVTVAGGTGYEPGSTNGNYDSSTGATISVKALFDAVTDCVTVSYYPNTYPGSLNKGHLRLTDTALSTTLRVDSVGSSTAHDQAVNAAALDNMITSIKRLDSVTYDNSGTASATTYRMYNTSTGYATANFRLDLDSVAATTSAGTYSFTIVVKTFDSIVSGAANKGVHRTSNTYAANIVLSRPTSQSLTANSTYSTAVMTLGSSYQGGTIDSVVSIPSYVMSSDSATVYLTLKNASNIAVASESVTAIIEGAGQIGVSGGAYGRNVTLAMSSNPLTIGIRGDGTAGTATVKISTASVTFAPKTVYFYSTGVAKITPTLRLATLAASSNSAAVTGVVEDSAGIQNYSNTAMYAYSSDTSVVSNYGTACAFNTDNLRQECSLTGLVAGTATITFRNAATVATSTYTAPTTVSVTVNTSSASTLKMALDKASYAPGEKGYLRVWAVDSAGKPVAPGTYTLLAGGIASSAGLGANSDLPVASTTTSLALAQTSAASGWASTEPVKQYVFYAPTAGGEITFTAVGGTGLPLANQVAVTAKATVTDNAATALAAVTALASQVSAFITKINAQITTLTDLVMKIQKKVKA